MASPNPISRSSVPADAIDHWIDGRAVRGHGRTLDVFNPATGTVARQVAFATTEDAAAAVASAAAAFPAWADTPPIRRARVLNRRRCASTRRKSSARCSSVSV
jgi:malonate-semialdehyde dehydrogenase (acetylating) / methylmalonate-semialdehyde dehydrogenase